MADARVRSALLSRVFDRARRGLARAERGLFGLEHLNSTADGRRGPEHWAALRAEARACFVLSTGRTGTMSLEALLALSPHIEAHHEPTPRLIALSYLAWKGVEEPDFWRQAVQVERDQLVFSALKRGRLYFEASNRMTFLAPALAAAYPRARFLIIARRPEGFVKSAVRRGYYQGHPWDHARPRPEAWRDERPEAKAAWLWRETYRFALDFAEAQPERTDVLLAEDLFAKDLGRVERLFGQLGVPAPPRRRMQAVLDAPRNAMKQVFPWGAEPALQDGDLAGCAELEARLGYPAEGGR
jgi:hypothetical protein